MSKRVNRRIRGGVTVALATITGLGCGSETVDMPCSEYYAETPSQLSEKAPGILHDPKTDLLWFRCNLGQTYVNGACVGKPSNKNFDSTISELEQLANLDPPQKPTKRQRSARGNQDLNFSNVSWRMPTEEEYDTITAVPCHSPKVDVSSFLDIKTDTYYWSITEGRNDTYACATRLKDGLRTCQTKKTSRNPTLLVADSENLLVADLE